MKWIQQERADKAFELSEEEDDELLRLFDLNAEAAQAAENRIYELNQGGAA